jgi:Acetyltransferase (GNAT) family.
MIIRVESKEQLDICLDIVHKSFQTVADEMILTKDNCSSYTAFMPIEKLISQFENNTPMLLYQYNGCFAGYFSLSINDDSVELNNLAVLPEYRHLGIGKELVDYAITYSKTFLAQIKLKSELLKKIQY